MEVLLPLGLVLAKPLCRCAAGEEVPPEGIYRRLSQVVIPPSRLALCVIEYSR
jgi:hypothetical protein